MNNKFNSISIPTYLLLGIISFGLLFMQMPLLALLQGGSVTQGIVSIEQDASAMTITQETDVGMINWNSFGIDNGEITRFVQPGHGSVTINRVVGLENSVIISDKGYKRKIQGKRG